MIRYGFAQVLNRDMLNSAQVIAEVGRNMGREIQAKVTVAYPAEEVVNYKSESSAWQLLKSRWFPVWLLKKFPVRYETFRVFILHPDIKVPDRQERAYYHVMKHCAPSFLEIGKP